MSILNAQVRTIPVDDVALDLGADLNGCTCLLVCRPDCGCTCHSMAAQARDHSPTVIRRGAWVCLIGKSSTGPVVATKVFVATIALSGRGKVARDAFLQRRIQTMVKLIELQEQALRLLPEQCS